MQSHSHSDIAHMEETNWWYVSRRRLLSRFIPRCSNALDVGCGVGANYPILAAKADHVHGVDIAPDAVAFASSKGYKEVIVGSVESLPNPSHSADLVLCTDVLEHVDDVQAIAEIHRVLRPGGTLIVTVPAFQCLWNENDDYSHHHRRYTKQSLINLVSKDFTVEHVAYWNHFMFFPVWLTARFYKKKEGALRNNLTRIPAFLNTPLIWMLSCERLLSFLPWGVSLVLVVRSNY